MKHSKTFEKKKALLKKREEGLKKEIDEQTSVLRVIVMAIAGGVMLLILNAIFRKRKRPLSTPKPAKTEKNKLLKWVVSRGFEIALYYLLSTKTKDFKR